MAVSKWDVGDSEVGRTVYVFGLEGNVEFFFGPAEESVAAGPSEATKTMPGGKRRMYPGDPGYNRAGYSAKYLKDPGVRYGQGVPGRSFSVACWDAQGAFIQRRRFSSTSSVRELNAKLLAHFLATPGLGKIMKHYSKGGGVHTFRRPAGP